MVTLLRNGSTDFKDVIVYFVVFMFYEMKLIKNKLRKRLECSYDFYKYQKNSLGYKYILIYIYYKAEEFARLNVFILGTIDTNLKIILV